MWHVVISRFQKMWGCDVFHNSVRTWYFTFPENVGVWYFRCPENVGSGNFTFPENVEL